MLFVGDVHINAKQSYKIIRELQDFVAAFPEEKNIVFLGDYMYMFSYDRQALADLFDFFLSLWDQGKNVYIMAGNHDWLNQHFIYHEGKKIADILNARTTENKIYFITEPATYTIEGKDFLFLPYNKEFLHKQKEIYAEKYRSQIDEVSSNKNNNSAINENTQTTAHIDTNAVLQTDKISPSASLFTDSLQLLASKNTNEQLSGALNMFIFEKYFGENNTDKKPITPILIHHYYTANTTFPGQFAKFDYKDIAIHPLWMQIIPISISGHLHKAFTHGNYTCVGSFWYTTSTERDQAKWLWHYSPSNNQRTGKTIAINPYITLDSEKTKQVGSTITTELLEQTYTDIYQEHTALLGENVNPGKNIPFDPAIISLILYSKKNMADIDVLITDDLKEQIHDIQYKQTTFNQKDMTELLDISQYNLQQSLLDRKELVKKYILSRYGTESEKYRTLLSELNIL